MWGAVIGLIAVPVWTANPSAQNCNAKQCDAEAECFIGEPSQVISKPPYDGWNNITIDGARVLILSGYVQGQDILSAPGHPSTFNPTTGVLAISGTNTIERYGEIITDVLLTSTDTSGVNKTVAWSLGTALFDSETGHTYEYFAQVLRWDEAKARCEADNRFGYVGYLATLTSRQENDFAIEKLEGDGWIGGSDSDSEGTWRWVTGCEGLVASAGTLGQVFTCEASAVATCAAAAVGQYSNWANNEPNNFNGDEDYVYQRLIGGWNDYIINNNRIEGYICEWGGDCPEAGVPLFPPAGAVNVLGCRVNTTSPTLSPSQAPSIPPTPSPSASPSTTPSDSPSTPPTASPSRSPTTTPSVSPSTSPSSSPSNSPTTTPTRSPTIQPSVSPTGSPTGSPTVSPSKSPTSSPTTSPTVSPSRSPTTPPTESPTVSPSLSPSKAPTTSPTVSPSVSPTRSPTTSPTVSPSVSPTFSPTTSSPTASPSRAPTVSPSLSPTRDPTVSPTLSPTVSPCDDGTHGCNVTGGVCVKLLDSIHNATGTVFVCSCAGEYECDAGCGGTTAPLCRKKSDDDFPWWPLLLGGLLLGLGLCCLLIFCLRRRRKKKKKEQEREEEERRQARFVPAVFPMVLARRESQVQMLAPETTERDLDLVALPPPTRPMSPYLSPPRTGTARLPVEDADEAPFPSISKPPGLMPDPMTVAASKAEMLRLSKKIADLEAELREKEQSMLTEQGYSRPRWQEDADLSLPDGNRVGQDV